ncbi:MAG: acyl-CoA dehydrogenase [Planctomycetota bacterium]
MWLFALSALVLAIALYYYGQTWLGWVAPLLVLAAGMRASFLGDVSFLVLFLGLVAAAAVTGIKPLRQVVLTKPLLPRIKAILPVMSETERIALEAGTVWWDADLFSGNPDWSKLHAFTPQPLTKAEQDFVEGPAEEICAMVDDNQVVASGDLSPAAWSFLKEKGFFGMIIPEEFGGLGFSGAAHSAVVTKLSSRSVTLAVTVMVPNSLGPAELLLHYGTKEQKDHYLPRLASGEEIPCFALTEPNAGSDAGGMTSYGVVCKGTYEGREVLGMRLNWDKRYITLAPIATVLGLAFKLEDPDGLLGRERDLGITCALIPADLDGVEIGERHDPLGVPFMNGPTRGSDVFVSLEAIIGGPEMAGHGWKMLMQSLAAGRGISLPSMASGAAQLVTRVSGAYATIRKQFNTQIGKFEGIEEPLARIGAATYSMNAARILTAGAVDAGEKPSVLSAVVKCYLTEGMRDVTNDAMDIVGGAGICRGPRNILANGYGALPIGITVEGANILTRTMIIFGQGAIRCHPYVQDEMKGAFEKDVALFDRAFFGHVGFVFHNLARSFVLGLTNAKFAPSPGGPLEDVYKQLTRYSAAFALTADFAMGTLGGTLKRKEKITGRLADALAGLYLASATLHRFEAEGRRAEDLPFAQWSCEKALYDIQEALRGVFRNLPLRPAAMLLRLAVFPTGARNAPPSDELGHRVAKALLDGSGQRLVLTPDVYEPPAEELGLGSLEAAHERVVDGLGVQRKIRDAVRARKLEKKPAATLAKRALANGVITAAEQELLQAAEAARQEAIAVDSFPQDSGSVLAGPESRTMSA